MIGYYNYTVILTYVGTLFGFVGILCIFDGNLKNALTCLMIAGLCDMFDGKIASTMKRNKREKRFGIQIDSLSDMICFGILPALIALHCSSRQPLSLLFCAAYILCALIRLAWFNVDEEVRQDTESNSREAYLGLPVTTAALLFPLFIGSAQMMHLPLAGLCPWFLLAIAVAFISPFPLKKPNHRGTLILLLCGATWFSFVLIGVMP